MAKWISKNYEFRTKRQRCAHLIRSLEYCVASSQSSTQWTWKEAHSTFAIVNHVFNPLHRINGCVGSTSFHVHRLCCIFHSRSLFLISFSRGSAAIRLRNTILFLRFILLMFVLLICLPSVSLTAAVGAIPATNLFWLSCVFITHSKKAVQTLRSPRTNASNPLIWCALFTLWTSILLDKPIYDHN